MMAKKLQKTPVGSETKRTYPVGKTVATQIGKTKTVAKIQRVQKAPKKLNKPAIKKSVKK